MAPVSGWVNIVPDECIRTCPQLQLLWGVPSLHWSVSIKGCPTRERWWSSDRVPGGRGSLMHVRREKWLVRSDPTHELMRTNQGAHADPRLLPKCYFDTYLSTVANHVHPFMKTVFPDGCGLFQQVKASCHKAEVVQEWFEEHNNEFEVLTWSPYSSDIDPINNLWNKHVWSM